MYNVHTGLQGTLKSVQCTDLTTVYSTQCTLYRHDYSVHSKVYSVQT